MIIEGSGSGRPKNMWIRWIRIRNTDFPAVHFWHFWSSKPLIWIPDPDPHWPKMLDPDTHWPNTDLQQCEKVWSFWLLIEISKVPVSDGRKDCEKTRLKSFGGTFNKGTLVRMATSSVCRSGMSQSGSGSFYRGPGSYPKSPVFRIRINWLRIPHFMLNTNPDLDPGFWWTKIEKFTSWKQFIIILIKNYNLLIPRPSKRTPKLQD